MEPVVILAAAAAVLFSCLAAGFAFMRGRRPPLRLPHEDTLEDRGDGLYRDDQPEEPALHRLPEMFDDLLPETLLPDPRTPARRGPDTIDHDPAEPGLGGRPGRTDDR
ncbi:hypothetical protein [Methylobacterium oryzihabitans]|uniref:Uncharacterized protein n=1 Tax=Methylobacterium oryzihabitans TaxID=2499852 RepID=A0A437PFN0_9HYPH|nr:hypothetical protein [Methylobacterium oryzihabitans]RVU21079.1 hypothetical protein EOE48_02995 [Methylobacterium oryzihabitans]